MVRTQLIIQPVTVQPDTNMNIKKALSRFCRGKAFYYWSLSNRIGEELFPLQN